MVVGIDVRVLSSSFRTGIGEYTENLLTHLLPLDKSVKYKLFLSGFKKPDLNLDFLNFSNVNLYYYKISNRFLLNPLQILWGQPKIDSILGGIDVFFNPHLFMPVSLSKNCRYVVTVHDLSFLHFPEFFPVDKLAWHKIETRPKKQLKRADNIISDSVSTKQDLINFYGVPAEKTKIIYPGIVRPLSSRASSDIATQPLRAEAGEARPPELHSCKSGAAIPRNKFILSLGTIEPRKNILGLIKAFEILKEQYKRKEKLCIVGNPGWLYKDVYKYAKKSKFRDDIVFVGAIKPEDRTIWYKSAEVFVYPSFFEGFGFPPLEAMVNGTPVVTSNTSSLPEVAADAALMVNPHNPQEIAAALNNVLSDPKLKFSLIKKGLKNVSRFSWQKCARETLKVLFNG